MKTIDLFCGCGGMSLGFELAGNEVQAGFDCWDKALEVYQANFAHQTFHYDLSQVTSAADDISRLSPEMVIGGPPCQDFSSAGKRNEDNGQGNLTVCFAQIVSYVRPRWFVMENVSTIVRTKKLADAKRIFKDAGYGMTECILDASLCGVPQKRKRFFLVGELQANDGFLLHIIQKNLSLQPLTVAEYMGSEIDFDYYYRHPRSYVRRGIFSVNEPSPTIRGVNRPMPKGYALHLGDPVKSLIGIRSMTTKERSRVQTFPKTFKFFGTKTDMEQMIGNAVPVNLARFVAESISEISSQITATEG